MAYLLAIESSCDETAAAVIDRERRVLSNVVASQDSLHQRFGGVVPEIASRAHVENILPVIDAALREAEVALCDVAAIAVASEPGLVGSLLVGLTAAKTLAWVLDKPLIPVNHVHAHLYACRLAAGTEIFPAVGLVVSGGHTNLYDCRSLAEFQLLGTTIDDAAGEAFDKVAGILELGYPGGPAVEQAARNGREDAIRFPRPMIHSDRLEFSFSGLKTAVLYEVKGRPGDDRPTPAMTEQRRADVAAGFQEAVVDVLAAKCRQALRRCNRSTLLVGGGVAANRRLREKLGAAVDSIGAEVHFAPGEYCTDNAAMAAIAWEALERGQAGSLDMDVTPGLIRMP
ncbi:MAG: tRNA (adenosine(37)-N6)-threonylcarbamoyltransferase complex transferase subunit TsaD [Planctomycetota bacterium]|nr:MAG: tRNA (adenosine(37)-N6)-threonylcarbamoyltransferase complex transferase subunit TsaD [Planctomycetota bacterium]REJ94025.1 MAG: tRNA (adenosine(37)-N6)-threonylcarbamoyltransferase complex transferase subunit TsaD [Planctomycetota bacterium]REK26899.1 MAG: tRNA (adenosine(37)-N6)-threonylcarbamoyltransferase complex transferase subunit TsaD [Planctomycetota bacterium]REK35387.1 MAG: tRNA (adenosine(37)-N6)-threonylcarbamoyltransferase complex transferase subunit TsaD [Planctomycetota ba